MTKPTIIMKRLLIAALTALMLICISSCSTTYYEPVFGPDNLPAVIPSEGGTYLVKYKYEFYLTKSTFYYEWACRTIIDGKVVGSENFSYDGNDIYRVNIPSNFDNYPKSITVEASTHVQNGTEDCWGDWTPIASAVQLAR